MSQDQFAYGAATILATLTAGTFLSRWWATPTPTTTVLSESELGQLLDGGEVDRNDFADCPAEGRATFHALRTDGSRRCWTCQTETPGGAV